MCFGHENSSSNILEVFLGLNVVNGYAINVEFFFLVILMMSRGGRGGNFYPSQFLTLKDILNL